MEHIYEPPSIDPAVSALVLGDLLPTGNETIPRSACDAFGPVYLAGTGTIMLSFFTAYRTEVANFVHTQTGSAGAGPTPTVCKMGVYQVNNPLTTTFTLTLLGATANDTSLFANPYSGYKRALLTPPTLVAGNRYAAAILVVSASSLPAIVCKQGAINDTYGNGKNYPPAYAMQSSGQTDLVDLSSAAMGSSGSNWNKAWQWFSAT